LWGPPSPLLFFFFFFFISWLSLPSSFPWVWEASTAPPPVQQTSRQPTAQVERIRSHPWVQEPYRGGGWDEVEVRDECATSPDSDHIEKGERRHREQISIRPRSDRDAGPPPLRPTADRRRNARAVPISPRRATVQRSPITPRPDVFGLKELGEHLHRIMNPTKPTSFESGSRASRVASRPSPGPAVKSRGALDHQLARAADQPFASSPRWYGGRTTCSPIPCRRSASQDLCRPDPIPRIRPGGDPPIGNKAVFLEVIGET